MVKTVVEKSKNGTTKDLLHTPKGGFVQKKKNQKFKNTSTGKVALINGSKTQNNDKQKTPEKNKETKKKNSPKGDKKQRNPKEELHKKNVEEGEEDESESDEDINEGVVLPEQSFMEESSDNEDEEESDEDDSEEEKTVTNILGTSLADDTDEDDEDYEEDEEELKENKGVKMFKGLKSLNDNNKSVKSSSGKSDVTSDGKEEEEDDENSDIDSEEVEEEEEEESDDEDEEEGEESTLGLKALLGNSLADDDEDEDFVETRESDEESTEEEEDEDEDDDDEEEDDDDDEDEEEVEEEINSTLDSPQQNKKNKEKMNDYLEEIKGDENTIFVGNLPKEVTKKQLKKQFKKFGDIDSIRLRGVVAKSLNIPKKVAAITKDIHPRLKSVYAYIKFHSKESAKEALSLNGEVFLGNYIRVDSALSAEEKPDQKKSVFVGNLPFNVDDNTFRKHFKNCGEIVSVRVVRDNKTGIGKGFGYINFKTEDSVALALELNGTKLANRELRVKPSNEQNRKGKDKHGKRSLSVEDGNRGPSKKQKHSPEMSKSRQNKQSALKRITEKQQKLGGKQTSPQQSKTFQGQKADGEKKKRPNKLEKKKKILAEKLAAKPKKPTN
ncbi:RNA-binding protein 34-like [Hylaeus anthracinus]|uniref:RNA-binding protein 34-like n=1 Tax=Hylaeus anthracinus TaxID=313031 RepID=UPI0023B8B188|nr:RNA-binding protein 34-like [Hylaeus anthracinus]